MSLGSSAYRTVICNIKKLPTRCSIKQNCDSCELLGRSRALWSKLAGSALLGMCTRSDRMVTRFLKSIAPLLPWFMHLLNDRTSYAINNHWTNGLLKTQRSMLTCGVRTPELWIYILTFLRMCFPAVPVSEALLLVWVGDHYRLCNEKISNGSPVRLSI